MDNTILHQCFKHNMSESPVVLRTRIAEPAVSGMQAFSEGTFIELLKKWLSVVGKRIDVSCGFVT